MTSTDQMTSAEWRAMNDLPPAGTLPEVMDVSGERERMIEVVWTDVRITGLPAYSLSPNSRAHWATKARDAAKLKAWAIECCTVNHHVSGPVRIFWEVYLAKGGKKRDRDNILPCLKPVQDAFVTRGYIDGDGPNVVIETSVEQIGWAEHKRNRPAIMARIRKVTT